MLKAAMYEFVVLDFLMPVIDGPDVARKFRAWEQEYRTDFHQVSVFFYIMAMSAIFRSSYSYPVLSLVLRYYTK